MDNAAQQLIEQARQVREFLEREGCRMTDLLGDFPRGGCGNGSDLLGQWLARHGVAPIAYVWGSRDGKSHGWLEHNGLVIDITSDQFDDGVGAVYVGAPTSFHASFTDQRRTIPEVSPLLFGVYRRMIERLAAGYGLHRTAVGVIVGA